jgi:hypothetical protein
MNADARQMPRVTVVVLHWGRPEDTVECVESLQTLDYPAFDVLIVDNGTQAEPVRRIAEVLPRVSVLQLPENRGFAGGANAGLARAKEQGSEYAWLLNNDTVVCDPACLGRLAAHALETQRWVLAPTLVQTAGRCETEHAAECFFPALALTLHAGRLSRFLALWANPVGFVSGTAPLIRLDAVPTPLFDESFFAYFEDVDVCIRIGASRFGACRDARIRHKVSRSTGGDLRKHRLKARNLVRLARKHGYFGLRFRAAYWCVFALAESRKYLASPLAYWSATAAAWREGAASDMPN